MGLLRLVWIRLKAALACLWAVVGRVFCCFRRRRKLSSAGLPTSVDVQVVPQQDQEESAELWGWEEQPSAVVTVEDKIREYRQSRTRLSSDLEQPQTEEDFFTDMTPSIRRTQKLLPTPAELETLPAGGLSSRLAYQTDSLTPQVSELTELEEPSAWEADDLNPDLLQSHQRALRQQQLQRKREQHASVR